MPGLRPPCGQFLEGKSQDKATGGIVAFQECCRLTWRSIIGDQSSANSCADYPFYPLGAKEGSTPGFLEKGSLVSASSLDGPFYNNASLGLRYESCCAQQCSFPSPCDVHSRAGPLLASEVAPPYSLRSKIWNLCGPSVPVLSALSLASTSQRHDRTFCERHPSSASPSSLFSLIVHDKLDCIITYSNLAKQ